MSDLSIGVVGATGALGAELLKVLGQATWSPSHLVPYASSATSVQFVEYKDEQVAVEDTAHIDFGALDAVIVAAPREVSARIVAAALEDGIGVVDCSGCLEETESWFVPWINPEKIEQVQAARFASIPSAPALLLSSVIGPLARAGVIGPVDATLMVGASHWGREGVSELSQQVVSLFNSATPPRKVFEHGLAFDLYPCSGALDDEGWSKDERELIVQTQALTGWPGVKATVVGVPIFTGVSMQLTIHTGSLIEAESLIRVLKEGGCKEVLIPSLASPRAIDGLPFAHISRVRSGGDGRIQIWAVMDNLTTVAVAAAGACKAIVG